MTPVALQNYGLVRIGRIELSDDLIFSIIFELDEAKAWQKFASANGITMSPILCTEKGLTRRLGRQKSGENAYRHTRVERCMHASPGTPLSRF